MSNELYERTRRLLRQLHYFIIHVVLYFVLNMVLILTAFKDIHTRWWIFFVVTIWAIGLIYHGFRVYGIDWFNPKNKKSNLFWSWLLKLGTS